MVKSNVVELAGGDTTADALTELLRVGAEQLVYQAVEAELQELLSVHSQRRQADVARRAWWVMAIYRRASYTRGSDPPRSGLSKVRSKTGEPVTFHSVLVPPYIRKTKTLEGSLPWLYLKGICSNEMGAALEVLVGPQAKGLSASTVSRLKQVWAHEYREWSEERLDKARWVYVWADGVYSGLRAEQRKLCALVVSGVNERGEKRFLVIEDGVRESRESWREVLVKLKSRGMNVAELAIGDGALGLWAALEELYGETRQQRCWMHKTMNVLNCVCEIGPGESKAGAARDLAG